MKSSTKKILTIILICLAVALGLYILVSFIVNKDGTMYWINYIWDMLNQPLPIVGVSSVALFVFVWQVVKYIRETKPSEELQAMKKEHEEYKEDSEKQKALLEKRNEWLLNKLKSLCSLSTNEKIKEFGKELGYGKETIDSETKAE